MAKILFVVMGFASHRTWAEGYQRYALRNEDVGPSDRPRHRRHQRHEVELEIISGERWKFRMMVAIAEVEDKILRNDYDIVVVDGMMDVTVLVALVKSEHLSRTQSAPGHPDRHGRQHRQVHRCPKFLVYMHENQLTTPFTSQDRDYNREKNPTHWHYGMAHYRSLMVVDGLLFNSHTHLEAFSIALPRVINEQCPRDCVDWHLARCRELLRERCLVLPYGLELDELRDMVLDLFPSSPSGRCEGCDDHQEGKLEEDKDPATFLDMLQRVRRRLSHTKAASSCGRPSFRLVVLGDDPSKDRRWVRRIEEEFREELLFCGWCHDRTEYARWLREASIVVSTARHETFGISIVESVYCGGALPLLPNRLSYPELFPPSVAASRGDFGSYLYSSALEDGVVKLCELLDVTTNHPQTHGQAVSRARDAVSRYRWDVMGPVYDDVFSFIADADGADETCIIEAGLRVESALQVQDSQPTRPPEDGAGGEDKNEITVISDASDPRVQLYRPKSLRVRMLEAISMGARIEILSFLTTRELAEKVLLAGKTNGSPRPPIYVCNNQEVLNATRGQKLNAGDSILALVQFPMASNLDELLANPPILILEDVRNAENVGSILRTAFCLGITSVVASPTAWAALRDTRGARCSMGTMYYHRYYKSPSSSLRTTIQRIREGGITVYGIEIGGTAVPVGPHRGTNPRGWAAILGNEDVGLSDEVADVCDSMVFVPQARGDSLNVGHAAAIAMFELGRGGAAVDHDGSAACK
jgi:tRNA G18 (ribose-2'-O)-methylase SpoU/glycosyltransferase involved in cell wall biosynthesis